MVDSSKKRTDTHTHTHTHTAVVWPAFCPHLLAKEPNTHWVRICVFVTPANLQLCLNVQPFKLKTACQSSISLSGAGLKHADVCCCLCETCPCNANIVWGFKGVKGVPNVIAHCYVVSRELLGSSWCCYAVAKVFRVFF